MRWFADLAYLVAALGYLPVALYSAVVHGKNRRGWRERFGSVRRRDPAQPRIWIHAVSLGEINATPRLIHDLQAKLPGYEIVVSSTTDTGFARAVELFGRDRVFRFPLDFSLVVSRALRRINPSLIVLMELEVWFNLIRAADARGVAVVVANGRLTQRSAKRLAMLGPLARSMFKRLRWVGAQDETIATRFRDLGTPPDSVEVTSSLKWDSATVGDTVDGAEQVAAALGIDGHRPVWVCGSTGPGEEASILEAYRGLPGGCHTPVPNVQDDSAAGNVLDDSPEVGASAPRLHSRGERPLLVLVPRKPERFGEVARLIERAGFECLRRSEHPDGKRGVPVAENTVILGDTLGELRKFYSLADVVFVGRSLVPMGGSDPMEVAALGKPIIVGPHMGNFAAAVAALKEADALRMVTDAAALVADVASLLDDAESRKSMGARAREVVITNQGATARTVDAIVRIIDAS